MNDSLNGDDLRPPNIPAPYPIADTELRIIDRYARSCSTVIAGILAAILFCLAFLLFRC